MTANRIDPRRLIAMLAVAVALALAALFTVGTAFAEGPDGASPEQALSPGSPQTLEPGQGLWYAFEYRVKYNEVQKKDEEKKYELEKPPITIWLDVQPSYGTNFYVWTSGGLNEWQAQQLERNVKDVVQPVGRGSENEYTPGEYSWTGEFSAPGRYYVLVRNDSLERSTHTLHIQGETVTLPVSAPAVAPAAPVAEVVPASIPAVARGGTSAEDALPVTGAWQRLEPDQTIWYAFDYSVTRKETVKHQNDEDKEVEKKYELQSPRIMLKMDAKPLYGTSFTVWTPGRLREWQAQQLDAGKDEKRDVVQPIGAGTHDEHANCDCSWVGEFNESGTYYVRVHNDSLEPSSHVLMVEMSD